MAIIANGIHLSTGSVQVVSTEKIILVLQKEMTRRVIQFICRVSFRALLKLHSLYFLNLNVQLLFISG